MKCGAENTLYVSFLKGPLRAVANSRISVEEEMPEQARNVA
jgi:hypothetical protein